MEVPPDVDTIFDNRRSERLECVDELHHAPGVHDTLRKSKNEKRRLTLKFTDCLRTSVPAKSTETRNPTVRF